MSRHLILIPHIVSHIHCFPRLLLHIMKMIFHFYLTCPLLRNTLEHTPFLVACQHFQHTSCKLKLWGTVQGIYFWSRLTLFCSYSSFETLLNLVCLRTSNSEDNLYSQLILQNMSFLLDLIVLNCWYFNYLGCSGA